MDDTTNTQAGTLPAADTPEPLPEAPTITKHGPGRWEMRQGGRVATGASRKEVEAAFAALPTDALG